LAAYLRNKTIYSTSARGFSAAVILYTTVSLHVEEKLWELFCAVLCTTVVPHHKHMAIS